MPAVSVIIPAYNAERLIVPAIESVLRQTFTDFEIVVVDDRSTDQSWSRIQAFGDQRVRPFRAERNAGASAARNLGIRQARGEWLAFLDADDQWNPRHLEVMMDCSNGNIFVAPSKLSCVPDADGRLRPLDRAPRAITTTSRPLNRSSFAEALGREYVFSKRQFILDHKIAFLEAGGRADGGEWMYYMSDLLLGGASGCWALEPTYLYRVTGYHTSSSFESIAQQLSVIERLSTDPAVPPDVRDSLAASLPAIRRRLNAAALRSGKWKEFFRLLGAQPSTIFYLGWSATGFMLRKIHHAAGRRGVDSA